MNSDKLAGTETPEIIDLEEEGVSVHEEKGVSVSKEEAVSVREKVRRYSFSGGEPSSVVKPPPNRKPKSKMELQALVDTEKVLLTDAEAKLKAAVESESVDKGEVRYLWAHYKRVHKAYTDLKVKLLDHFQKKNLEDDYVMSKRVLFDYERDLFKYEENVNVLLEPVVEKKEETTERKRDVRPSNQPESSMRMILPRRELPKFTGEVREWLGFVASFTEIDLDGSLSDTDKFHYLIQSTVDGSPARKLLESFPFSSANYKTAFKDLKERFGRKSTLVKVYVRDLLQLVIGVSTGRKIDFCDLVTTNTSQIRNLSTLGVAHDQCSLILYPVVVSCLPLDVLQAWQRSNMVREDLECLLTFLHHEVHAQTDRDLANFTFGSIRQDRGNKFSNSNFKKKFGGDVPTASSFVSAAASVARSTNEKCGFCDRFHSTVDCKTALRMTAQVKNSLLRGKGYCFICLQKDGHIAKTCRANPKCDKCKGKHHPVMCFNKEKARESSARESVSQPERATSEAPEKVAQLSNSLGSVEVPMQTLVVTVHGTNGKTKNVRMMIDTGSARSYMK